MAYLALTTFRVIDPLHVFSNVILPHNAMLVQFMLSSCVCPSVSVCHKPALYQHG